MQAARWGVPDADGAVTNGLGARGFIRGFAIAFCALAALLGSAGAAVAVPPTIDREWVTEITENDAVLHAEINPGGLYTKYKLQIDVTGNFDFDQNDSCELHPPEVGCGEVMEPGEPQPDGLAQPPEKDLAASDESQHVSATVGTLQPRYWAGRV